MNNLLLLIVIIFFVSCNSSDVSEKQIDKIKTIEKNPIEERVTVKVDNPKEVIVQNEEKLLFKKKVLFGDIEIHLEENNGELSIKSNNEFVEDKLIKIDGFIDTFIETDVDKNGFNEFYCVSNVGDLIAFSSFKNKSYGEISVLKKPFNFYKDCKSVKFWEAKNKSLLITFSNSKNELNIVRYKLIQGENSYQLIAE